MKSTAENLATAVIDLLICRSKHMHGINKLFSKQTEVDELQSNYSKAAEVFEQRVIESVNLAKNQERLPEKPVFPKNTLQSEATWKMTEREVD